MVALWWNRAVFVVSHSVSLGITTLLTMTTLISGAKQGLPAVSYIKVKGATMADNVLQ